jgi:hypothetical protein
MQRVERKACAGGVPLAGMIEHTCDASSGDRTYADGIRKTTDVPAGRLGMLYAVLGVVAQFENDVLRRRHAGRQAAGERIGRPARL